LLVHYKEPTQPRAEEPDHRGIGVREEHVAISLGTLTRVQSHARCEKRGFGHFADPIDAEAVARFDLDEFGEVLRVRATVN
jgi:hypothetical protein